MKQIVYMLFFISNIALGQGFESLYGKTRRCEIATIENDDMIEAEVMFIKIDKDFIEVSVESQIKENFCADILYPPPTKLSYKICNNNRLVIDNRLKEKNKRYQLLSLILKKGKIIGKLKVNDTIKKIEFK